MKTIITLGIASAFLGGLVALSAQAQALSSRYGCYEVTVDALNIREKAWSRSKVVAVARRGEKLAKRRRFCALRGFWCPVTNEDGVSGWAGKQFLKRTPC